jgi:roadblock/LC7 domain-containing protein
VTVTFIELMEPLLSIPGVLAAAFFDPQGQVIIHVGNRNEVEVLGAYQSVWLSTLARSISGEGSVKEVSVEFEGRKAIAVLVGESYYLAVVFASDSIPARGWSQIERARKSLVAEIG